MVRAAPTRRERYHSLIMREFDGGSSPSLCSMKHYKIVKKTFYGLNREGLTESSYFIPFKKVGIFWERIKEYHMYSCGFISDSDIGFNSLERAEDFIKRYHEYRNKVGTYSLEVVAKIDLE